MRKILATALCAVVAMGYFMVNSGKNEPMSDLMQANVKALAENSLNSVPCLVLPNSSCTFEIETADGKLIAMSVRGLVHV